MQAGISTSLHTLKMSSSELEIGCFTSHTLVNSFLIKFEVLKNYDLRVVFCFDIGLLGSTKNENSTF